MSFFGLLASLDLYGPTRFMLNGESTSSIFSCYGEIDSSDMKARKGCARLTDLPSFKADVQSFLGTRLGLKIKGIYFSGGSR